VTSICCKRATSSYDVFSANEDPITAAMEFLTLQNMHFRAPAIESINQGFDGGDGCGDPTSNHLFGSRSPLNRFAASAKRITKRP